MRKEISGDDFMRSPAAGEMPLTGQFCCLACDSQPLNWLAWDQTGDAYEVCLNCPECSTETTVIVDEETFDRQVNLMDEARESIHEGERVLGRMNQEQWTNVFAKALHANHILPEDF